jgi:predicted transcriptional regulator
MFKRPHPSQDKLPAPRQYTENEYADALRRQAILDGQRTSTIALDCEYIDAIRDGCDTTASIANYVECNSMTAFYRLKNLEKMGMIKSIRGEITHWRLT